MTDNQSVRKAPADLLAAVRNAARQEQFLEVVSAAEARKRFESAIDLGPLASEIIRLENALDRVLAVSLAAPTDVPAFDRSVVDGFAVRAADTTGSSDRTPRRLILNAEVIACGHAPTLDVRAGTASAIATGGVIPRGADAVVMIEHTDLLETREEPMIVVRRAVGPGQFVSFAGSDIARGEAVGYGAFPDSEVELEAAVRRALAECDMVVISGGTSKGVGDLSYRILSRIGLPGVLVHGVALKPGKPLCLAAVGGKPIAVLPGFPTSAIFTFHAFAAPVIRRLAGLPAEAAQSVTATVPVRITSEMGREEFVLVALVPGEKGLVAFPTGKGSGAVTSFSQADR